MDKFCKECQVKVMKTMKICPSCGNKSFSVTIENQLSSKNDNTSDQIINQTQHTSNSYNTDNSSSSLIGNFMAVAGAGFVFIIFLVIGIIQIYAGYLGIEYEFGNGWAITALVLAFFLRITLPLTIGTFICAYYVWSWPLFGALLFTIPGLLFVIPGLINEIIREIRK